MSSTDGDSHQSWAWWLDALEAMRRTYSIPMDAREARIRADVDDARRKEAAAAVCRGPTVGAVKNSRAMLKKLEKSRDPEAAWEMRSAEESDLEEEDWSCDPESLQAGSYRHYWNYVWARIHGSFEHTTAIPAMRFTDEPADSYDRPRETLQIFSVKVTETSQELRWPLDVYGLIAIRDKLDRKRNVIFARSRDNCQTITKEDPYFRLIGPTRAVVLSSVSDTVRFEVALKVKGTNELEDEDFSFLAMKYRRRETNHSCVVNLVGTSRLSRLEWTLGYLVKSVEATINIQLIHGSWPDGCQGVFTASSTVLNDMNVPLLYLQDDKLPVTVDGMINLSRHVACVEMEGQLKISIATEYVEDKQVSAKDDIVFTPRTAGRSCAILKVRSCVMKVIVGWSLVSTY